MIPKDYSFEKDPEGAQAKLQGMIDRSVQDRKDERSEFKENRERKQKYATEDAEFDADRERTEFHKLLEQREQDKAEAAKYLETEMFSISDPVDDRLRGAFTVAAVSTIADRTTQDVAKQEHAFIVHNTFKSVEEATAYIKRELEVKVVDLDIFVVEMYQWMQPSFSFSDFVMDHVPTEYRDKMQNEIMQFKMSGARLKRESLEARYNCKMPSHEITDGEPAADEEGTTEKTEPLKEGTTEEEKELEGMQIGEPESSEEETNTVD